MDSVIDTIRDLAHWIIKTATVVVILSAGGIAIALFVLITIVWRLWLSPLARQRIPGPIIAAITDGWWLWHQVRFDRAYAVQAAFEKYGPIVRVGPKEVVFRNEVDVGYIYHTEGFIKGPFYKVVAYAGLQTAFNTANAALHALHRAWSAPAFVPANLRIAMVGPAIELMNFLVPRIQQACKDEPKPHAGPKDTTGYIDAMHLYRQLCLDGLGFSILGVRFNQLASGNDVPYSAWFDEWTADKALQTVLPTILYKLLHYIPIKSLQATLSGDPNTVKYVSGLYDSHLANEGKKPGPPTTWEDANILSTMIRYRDPVSGQRAPKNEVVSEAAIMVAAGTDSTKFTLVYFTYHLALAENASVYNNLRAELATVPESKKYDLDVLSNLAYLNAVLWEILRVRGSANGTLERIDPSGGAVLSGYALPGDTLVGGQAWSAARDPSIFPDPLRINPERWVVRGGPHGWVNKPAEETKVQRANWYPFSQGWRRCVGRPLAEWNLQYAASTLARNFRFILHPTVTEAAMTQVDKGVISPKATTMFVRFENNPI